MWKTVFKPLEVTRVREEDWMRLLSWSVLALATAGYLIACYQLQRVIADDAYISFRFARNLAEGYGLVWNIGGEPVEGYTDPLWVFLLSGVCRLGFDIEKIYPWLAIGATLGTIVLILNLVQPKAGRVHPWVTAIVAFYLSDRYAATHTVSGMETQ